MFAKAEYVWIDGVTPTHHLRSKTRVIEVPNRGPIKLHDFPEWSFDGSSTDQAVGSDSDLVLQPVKFCKDPIRGGENYLVLCEVNYVDGKPHESNARAQLRRVLDNGGTKEGFVFGFEQEYTMFQNGIPLNWPENGYPSPQGPYYCGVGADRITGRELVEDHLQACIDAGLLIYGVNAEVMYSQWEFQIGYRGFEADKDLTPLKICDDHWLAMYLLHRIGEKHGITINFQNKPVKGDWNGSGCHTNFSSTAMRSPETGKKAIAEAIDRLSKKHIEHISVYGYRLSERLTGEHETCSIDVFRFGESDRGASIRVPVAVQQKGYGYLEDRRPGANADPYISAARIIMTVCDLDESLFDYKIKYSDDILRLRRNLPNS